MATSSAETSPMEHKDIEKADFVTPSIQATEKEGQHGLPLTYDDKQQKDPSTTGTGTNGTLIPPHPLHQTVSHSSARSQQSHTDGYTHFSEGEQQHPPISPHPADHDKEFEVSFDGDLDPWNPKNRSKARKWGIVLIGSICSFCVTCASALYTSTYEQLAPEFGVSRLVATIGLTTFVCGMLP